MNDALRRAIFQARFTEDDVAVRLGVDPKTVRRWLAGRLPYPRHRWDLATLLDADETDLWPELRAVQAEHSRPTDFTAVYPHRSSVSLDGWRDLFESADHEIDILAYSGLFLAEDPKVVRILTLKARAGVRIRIALGDPESPHVATRGSQEDIGDAMAAKIRNALVLYRPLAALGNVDLRLHDTVLYNSIYRADDQLLVNQHAYGVPAAHAPIYHFRETPDGELFHCYTDSFQRVWAHTVAPREPSPNHVRQGNQPGSGG